jgi:hypothetical protein
VLAEVEPSPQSIVPLYVPDAKYGSVIDDPDQTLTNAVGAYGDGLGVTVIVGVIVAVIDGVGVVVGVLVGVSVDVGVLVGVSVGVGVFVDVGVGLGGIKNGQIISTEFIVI